MYTKIDHNLAKEAFEYWLTTHPECLPRNISKEFVLEALSIVLEFNTFTYNGRFYLIHRISMGTKSAPTIATLVMAYLEIKLYQVIETKYGRLVHKAANGEDFWMTVSSTGTRESTQQLVLFQY